MQRREKKGKTSWRRWALKSTQDRKGHGPKQREMRGMYLLAKILFFSDKFPAHRVNTQQIHVDVRY